MPSTFYTSHSTPKVTGFDAIPAILAYPGCPHCHAILQRLTCQALQKRPRPHSQRKQGFARPQRKQELFRTNVGDGKRMEKGEVIKQNHNKLSKSEIRLRPQSS